MSFLFGSAPKVVQSGPQATVNPSQQQILNTVTSNLQGTQGLPAAYPNLIPQYPSTTVAPQTSGQLGIIQQLLQLAGGINPDATGAIPGQAATTFGQGLNFQAPQVTAPQVNFDPTVPTIDPTQAFVQGVVNPVTKNFQQTVIPSLNAGAGRSAGGIYSSDLSGATDQAVSNLDTTLIGAGAQYSLGAAQANQAAQETTNALKAQIAEANQGATTAANALNTGATLTGQGLTLQDLGLGPTVAGLPFTGASDTTAILNSLFPTISTPQTTTETGLQTQIGETTQTSQLAQALEQLAASASVSPTQQNTSVAQAGSTGFLPNLLTSLAGNPGVGTAIGSGLTSLFALMSDERTKEDIQKVGRLDKTKLPVYTFRYKGEPPQMRRIGLIAQDVERVVPEAVGQAGPFKTVNYASVALAERFKEAA